MSRTDETLKILKAYIPSPEEGINPQHIIGDKAVADNKVQRSVRFEQFEITWNQALLTIKREARRPNVPVLQDTVTLVYPGQGEENLYVTIYRGHKFRKVSNET